MPRWRCALAMTGELYMGCGGAGRGGGPYGEHQELRGRDDVGSELSAAGGRMKRAERVAAAKISSARRKAAQKFWAPQQDHRPIRKRNKKFGKRAVGDAGPYGGVTRSAVQKRIPQSRLRRDCPL